MNRKLVVKDIRTGGNKMNAPYLGSSLAPHLTPGDASALRIK